MNKLGNEAGFRFEDRPPNLPINQSNYTITNPYCISFKIHWTLPYTA
jgi:hypothetical protein